MFTKEQKLRLKALLSKEATTLSVDEKNEIAKLQDAAKAANWNPETDSVEDSPESMTEAEVKNVVVNALKGIGLDADSVEAIKKGITAGGKSITLTDVTSAIEKHLGGKGIDQEALIKAVKDAIPTNKGVTQEDLDAALKKFAGDFKAPSRHEFPVGGEQQYPIEHRAGNLTVAQKQLLNICLMHVSEGAIKSGKSVRPTSQDEGITPAQLDAAARAGDFACKSIRTEVSNGRKAITAGGSGSGAELVSVDLSSDLQRRLYLESAVAAEFTSQEIQMPTNPFMLPMTTTRPTFLVGSEGVATTASTPATARPTLTAGKLIGMSDYSYEAEEDSIIAILPLLQEQLGEAAADALECAIINGDTTGTHQDSDFAAVDNHAAKLFKGLRKYALAGGLGTSLATGGLSSADSIGALRKAMGKYGIKPRDLLILAGVKGTNDLIQLAETLTFQNVGTGTLARILTGEAPSIYGIRIITSAQIREDLNASGVHDGVTSTKGSIIILHRPSFLMGVRRGFMVEVWNDKRTQLNSVIASFRRAFIPKETPSTSQPMVVMGYNYNA